MAMTGGASLRPGLKCLIKTFNAIPVKKRSRIEKHDRGGAHTEDHRKIDVRPCLLHWFGVGNTAQRVGSH